MDLAAGASLTELQILKSVLMRRF